MSTALLTTKLYIPPQRPDLVFRPQLMARLMQAQRNQHHLTLVSAKAGAGKTTLISEWLHQQQQPATWLSLDANDNDPRRFTSYLIAAIQKLNPKIGHSTLNQLETPQLLPAEDFLANLINELATSSPEYILVLDDYHLIQTEWIHQAVGFLIEHQPPEAHMILATRVDPPLPLARYRGRGQITEIRDQDLRFSAHEAAQFLNEIMNLDLPQGDVSTLEWRTEGWIAGLQMAAITMQGHKQDGDLTAFIEAFGGTNRFILDYLLEEVLNQQETAIQDFLMETSILERMCAGLCDAVRFGETKTHDSRTILTRLARTNLFVVPLDDELRWFRYHHLFADLLNSNLRQHRTQEEILELHRRASRWHQAHGSLEEAMSHAMTAQDFETAAVMIDKNIASMLSRSEAPTLLAWIGRLPEQIVSGRPWIDIYRANTLALSGQAEQANTLLDAVEKRVEPDSPRSAELFGHIAAIRAFTANLHGDAERVIEMGQLSEKYLPEENLNGRAMVAYALADTYFAQDDMENARHASNQMLMTGEKSGRLLMAIPALCDLAAIKKVQGKLRQAEELYERARQWMLDRNGLDTRVRCPYEIGLAELLREWNQLEAAKEHVRTGIEYSRRFGVSSQLDSGYLTLMRILLAQGDLEGAFEALNQAEQIMQIHHVRLATRVELKASRVGQWLAVGDLEMASHWAQECNGGSELEQITLARLKLAQGRADEAYDLLDQQRLLAETGGRIGRLIEILGLLSLTLNAQDQPEDAQIMLNQAIYYAKPERYLRIFLDFGKPLYTILERSMIGNTSLPDLAGVYISNLLNTLDREIKASKVSSAQGIPQQSSVSGASLDPLTERELDVLRLLAEGLTNKDIASRLVVAPSTIKQHLKNIYCKLDVHSRTQAVARSRELGLI